MDIKSKRVGTFKQFLKEQSVKKINEARVSLEVDWWDEGIVEVMQILMMSVPAPLIMKLWYLMSRASSAYWGDLTLDMMKVFFFNTSKT